MTYQIRAASPAPAAFTRRPRPGGIASIDQVHIHTTRGPNVPEERQLGSMENYFADTRPWPVGNSHDGGAWGGSAEFGVGPDYRLGGQIAIVQFGDWRTTYSSFSAGFGALGWRLEHAAATRGIAIEIAQQGRLDAIAEESLVATAWLCRQLNTEIVAAGGQPIPVVRIPYWSQLKSEPILRGFIGHEDLANGRKSGKSDPGPMFDWDHFLDLVGFDEPVPSPNLGWWALVKSGMQPPFPRVRPLTRADGRDRYEVTL